MTYLLLPLTGITGAFGLIFGSFFNVVIWRVPRGESIVRPASACPVCHAPIRARDNVPVLSWVLLRGRCRDCSTPISVQYPAVELLTGAAFAVVGLVFLPRVLTAHSTAAGVSAGLELAAAIVLAAATVVLSGTDLSVQRLPDAIVLPIFVAGVVLLTGAAVVGGHPLALMGAAIGALASFVLYFAIAFIRPGGMGWGDVKLAGVLGLYLGYAGWAQLVVGVSAAFVLGGLVGIVLIIARVTDRKGGIPFGVFMLLGAWVGIFVGAPIASAYLRFTGLT